MLKILLIEEHVILREGLKTLLASEPGIRVEEELESVSGLRALRQRDFNVIIYSCIDPGYLYIENIKQIKNLRPKIPVLILSAYSEPQFCQKAIKAGASGFLTKQSAREELVKAITTVTNNRKYICPSLMDEIFDFSDAEGRSAENLLSVREYEVMQAITSGKRVKQIAKEMNLSVKTISTYHSRILDKLRFNNDAEMIRYAIEQGLVRNSIAAKSNLVLAELNFKTGSVLSAISEIWHIRKDVVLILIAVSIIAYVFLTFIISIIF